MYLTKTLKKQIPQKMQQLTKWQSLFLLIGSVLMVAGVGLYVFCSYKVATWIFLLGALVFASMQLQQCYNGKSIVIRRLRKIMIIADLFFVVAGLLMIENAHNFLMPFFIDHLQNGMNKYIIYIMGKWVPVLLIAAILEVYTTHRISHELEKEAKKL